MISALNGSGCDDVHGLSRQDAAGRSLVLSGRPDLRSADAPACRRNHPRKAVPAPASGASLFLACRNGKMGRAQGRLRSHRAGDLCRARQPEEDRARQERRGDQGDLHRRPARSSPKSSSSRCTSSCSSRCAKTGATIPSASARWGSSFRSKRQAPATAPFHRAFKSTRCSSFFASSLRSL